MAADYGTSGVVNFPAVRVSFGNPNVCVPAWEVPA